LQANPEVKPAGIEPATSRGGAGGCCDGQGVHRRSGADETQPPWVDPFGWRPSPYEVADSLFVPRSEELDASGPAGRVLYGLVSEARQALEHASSLRCHLRFGLQGTAAYAHLTDVLTRLCVSVRDTGTVERVLSGGSLSG